MKKRIKTNGFIIFAVVVTIILFPGFFFRHKVNPLSDILLETLGFTCVLLGQLIRVSARGYKAEQSHSGHALIHGGPYALVRNPMYLGISFIGIGIVAVLFKLWLVGVFLAIFSTRYFTLIFVEEARLAKAFPQEYVAYRKRTPRLVPKIKALFDKDMSAYFPIKLRWLKKEIGSMIAVLSAVIILKSWRDFRNEGLEALPAELLIIFVVIILGGVLVAYLRKMTADE